MPERRFTDEEVALILREVSEVQEGGRRSGAGGGLTLTQLKEIASEVGFDPGQVEAAAARLDQYRAPSGVPFLGTPVTPQFERELPGELTAEDFGELLTTIRMVLGRRGLTDVELDAFEWQARDFIGGRYVSVTPRHGKTRIRVFGNFRDGAWSIFLAGGMLHTALFAGVLSALGVVDFLGIGALPVAVLLSLLPARAIWRWKFGRESRALADVAEALEQKGRELLERRWPDAPGSPEDVA